MTTAPPSPPSASSDRPDPAALAAFVARWTASSGAERANKDAFLLELCDALGVPRPEPTTGDPERDRYVFEKDAILPGESRATTTRKVDLYRHGCFILEAKQGSDRGLAGKVGTARRETSTWTMAMEAAYGQAWQYAQAFDPPPPFLVVCDIGHCFDLYAAFDGSLAYRAFPDGARKRLLLADLARDPAVADTLRRIFVDPHSLDPARNAARVTREIAAHLAEVARALDAAGHAPERVAAFLMRCLFTMFAEDVGLLPPRIFTRPLDEEWRDAPARFAPEVETLWRAMAAGGSVYGVGRIRAFGGELFADPFALPLDLRAVVRLAEAARASWTDVEPSIFGTLLERALDPRERHRLGAHYTPRAYVERLVRPTIEEPLRAEWDATRAAANLLVAEGRVDEAAEAVRAFHRRLCTTRVLDPACGTGNFLYVTLDLFQRLESEVLALAADLGDRQANLEMAGLAVTPAQFLGIEVKPWARGIASLVLWIGWLQSQIRRRGGVAGIAEPVLRDHAEIELRDAVLAWDAIEPVLDAEGKPVTRWDGVTTKPSPVTGEEIPDESARVAVVHFVNARPAEWPAADFVVGNPPFVGTRRMRLVLGDGYVEALFRAWPEMPENADYVMYWWNKAASEVTSGRLLRFGLITTNSIGQSFNRAVLHRWLADRDDLSVQFAIPDHPWVDSSDGAAVRVAMTVGSRPIGPGKLVTVLRERNREDSEDETPELVLAAARSGAIQEDLRIGASVARAATLRSNRDVAYWGVKFYGDGFIVSPDVADELAARDGRSLARRFVSGKDLTSRPRDLRVIDCDGLSEGDTAAQYPAHFQHLLDRVKPVRAQNPRALKRDRWWIFGENQPGMRRAVQDLPRYIVTTETSKHRVFHSVTSDVLAEGSVAVIALADLWLLGVLSSRVHVTWALAAGGRLGVGNDPRYNKTLCFDPFPFPAATDPQKSRIRDLAERLDAHRKARQAEHPKLTITEMYNVMAKLRSGEALSEKERAIHDAGLVSLLRQLHDELDAAVFDAYGWPPSLSDEEILERLVALNAERAAEERAGLVRWLRPEYQNPGGTSAAVAQPAIPGAGAGGDDEAAPAKPAAKRPWPADLAGRSAAVRDAVEAAPSPLATDAVAAGFERARVRDVEEILRSLAALGLVRGAGEGGGPRWRSARG